MRSPMRTWIHGKLGMFAAAALFFSYCQVDVHGLKWTQLVRSEHPQSELEKLFETEDIGEFKHKLIDYNNCLEGCDKNVDVSHSS